jgi:hypothetical protein
MPMFGHVAEVTLGFDSWLSARLLVGTERKGVRCFFLGLPSWLASGHPCHAMHHLTVSLGGGASCAPCPMPSRELYTAMEHGRDGVEVV